MAAHRTSPELSTPCSRVDLPGGAPESAGLDSKRLARIVDWQQEMVDKNYLPFSQVVVGRHGRVAHFSSVGYSDVEQKTEIAPDSMLRFFSMTKPVTAVALMILLEEGRFLLNDPVSKFLGPKWSKENMMVLQGSDQRVPLERPITVKHCLMHTCGLSYGFDPQGKANKVDPFYAKALKDRHLMTLEQFCDKLAEQPLLYQPGDRWGYCFGIDVCGRLVEVISGKPLDVFMQERIFSPLSMVDTHFHVPESKRGRVAKLYMPVGVEPGLRGPDYSAKHQGIQEVPVSPIQLEGTLLEGGAGLFSTISDYARFAQMLLAGGTLDGQRILSRKTVEYMTVNHLKQNSDMASLVMGGTFTEVAYPGVGFGLGMAVAVDPPSMGQLSSAGGFGWGGAASTWFWCDPQEDLFFVFTTQLIFRNDALTPVRNWINNLVYSSLAEDPDADRSRTRGFPNLPHSQL